MSTLIPVIDCNGFITCNDNVVNGDTESIGTCLVDALSTLGCAYLTNTGVNTDSIEDVFRITEKFFRCPEEEKKEYTFTFDQLFGYVGMETETMNSNSPGDYKEAFIFGAPASFQGETYWPDELTPGLSGVIKRFMTDCKNLSFSLLDALSVGMGLKEDSYLKHQYKCVNKDGNLTAFKSTYYPPVPRELKAGQLRHGEHTDFTALSLLFHDDVGGLQLEFNGEYEDITPLEGGILLMAGDIISMQTRDQLKAPRHRVIVPKDEEARKRVRHSLTYFLLPDSEVVVTEDLLYKDEEINQRNSKNLCPARTTKECFDQKVLLPSHHVCRQDFMDLRPSQQVNNNFTTTAPTQHFIRLSDHHHQAE